MAKSPGFETLGRRSRSERLRPKAPKPPTPPRRRPRSKAHNLAWAVFFFILGVIGVLVPIMPQIPFFVMSLLFFSLVFPSVRRKLRRFLHRHPRVAHAYKKWRDAARKKRQKLIRKEKELAAKLHRHHR
jgi:Flp pilus assembly protein TadB